MGPQKSNAVQQKNKSKNPGMKFVNLTSDGHLTQFCSLAMARDHHRAAIFN